MEGLSLICLTRSMLRNTMGMSELGNQGVNHKTNHKTIVVSVEIFSNKTSDFTQKCWFREQCKPTFMSQRETGSRCIPDAHAENS